MWKLRLRRPSPALVVACIALLVALGGTSYATVVSVPRNSVGTPELKRNAVSSAKLAPNAVQTAHVTTGLSFSGSPGATTRNQHGSVFGVVTVRSSRPGGTGSPTRVRWGFVRGSGVLESSSGTTVGAVRLGG